MFPAGDARSGNYQFSHERPHVHQPFMNVGLDGTLQKARRLYDFIDHHMTNSGWLVVALGCTFLSYPPQHNVFAG